MAGFDLPGSLSAQDRTNTESTQDTTGANLFESAYNQEIQLAQVQGDTPSDDPEPLLPRSGKVEIGKNDPLQEFWSSQEQSPSRLIPGLEDLDNSWKPFYEELVKSEGYQQIQNYRRAAEGFANYVAILTPEPEREPLTNALTNYVKGAISEEALNDVDPNLLQYAKPMKEAANSPDFHLAKELAETLSPLIEYSAEGRDIIAEELAKEGIIGIGMQLMLESRQLRNFIENSQLKSGYKYLVNDSSTTA